MTNTVSYGVIGFTDQDGAKSEISAPNSTIVYSTVVGRRSFGSLKHQSTHEEFHPVRRRRSSAM
jgi:hypothetical protein